MESNGIWGCIVLVKPYPVITPGNPTATPFTPNNALPQQTQTRTSTSFSFNANQVAGLTQAQTAALVRAIPPQAPQTVNTGPATQNVTTTTTTNNENLPQTTTTTTTTQPQAVTVNNTIVTITLNTSGPAAGPVPGNPNINVAGLMAGRLAAVRQQLINQGVNPNNIRANINYGQQNQGPQGNSTSITVTNTATTTTGTSTTSTSTTTNYTYGK